MKSKLFTLFAATSLFVICGIDSAEASAHPSCLPTQEAAIADYIPGQKKELIPNSPKPLKTVESRGEDDGGVYTGTLLKYELYQVAIVRGVVDSVSTGSRNMSWAKGIKIGDPRDKVDTHIGYAKVFESEEEAQYLVCSDAADVYAILNFSSGVLARIEVVLDRP